MSASMGKGRLCSIDAYMKSPAAMYGHDHFIVDVGSGCANLFVKESFMPYIIKGLTDVQEDGCIMQLFVCCATELDDIMV